MPRGDNHRERAKQYLLTHPNATNRDVREACSVSTRTVTNARADLIAENLAPPAWGDHKKPGEGTKLVNPIAAVESVSKDVFDVKTTSDLNAEVAKELAREQAMNAQADAELTPDGEIDVAKLKKVLWRVVYRNTDDRIVVAAASALARIQAEAQQRAPGPGKPMTEIEAIDRLLMVLNAVGANIVMKTLNIWMERIKGNVSASPQTAQSSVSPPAPVPPVGEGNDNPRS